MDDLEFRRRCYSNPQDSKPDFLEKMAEDENARFFAHELRIFDSQLAQALATPVPEDLADKILLQQSLHQHQRFRSVSKPMLAMAAALVLGIAISAQLWFFNDTNGLAKEMLAHVYNEPQFLQVAHNPPAETPQDKLNSILASFGAQCKGEIGTILHVSYCDIVGERGMHLVLQGSKGVVTVLYAPTSIAEKPQRIADHRLHGELIPVQPQQGNLAIIGEQGEALEPFKQRLMQQVQWRI
ncbi:DUF3379 family protein [Candidatus Venteria ishoeyi]|uniref:DUF3379 family protein n=2 Tax=Candidatus Venteria ishoeyi TaxID=1899563 RepID=UPI0025A4EA6F|nr:DUF3379 family protein [Candidatus Venteria ishoeyi]MDM8546326.1 DUF3379 family protein [Candidatus Venteria ishoeyi]